MMSFCILRSVFVYQRKRNQLLIIISSLDVEYNLHLVLTYIIYTPLSMVVAAVEKFKERFNSEVGFVLLLAQSPIKMLVNSLDV